MSNDPFTFDFHALDDPDEHQRWSTWRQVQPLCRGPKPRPSWVVTDQGAIDSELGVLKTGKEADVFLLQRATPGTDGVVANADGGNSIGSGGLLRNGLQLHASEATENMYSSVDMALAKMERQVRRYKARIKHHKADEGRTAKVKLDVSDDGSVAAVSIVQPSGSSLLDKEALAAIKRVGTFPAPPGGAALGAEWRGRC